MNGFMVVCGLLLLVVLAGFCAGLSRRTALGTITFLSLPQLKFLGMPLATQTIFALATLPSAMRSGSTKPGVVRTLWLLIGVNVISLAWSDDRGTGMSRIFGLLCFMAAILNAQQLARRTDQLRFFLMLASPFLLVEAVTTIAFRVSPALEATYLRSPLAVLLLGGSATRIFDDMPNNVLSPDKAGGILFVNANVAGMFLGSTLILIIASLTRGSSFWLRVLGLTVLAGTVAAGSKTALALLVLIPTLAWAAPQFIRPGGRSRALLLSTTALSVFLIVLIVSRGVTSGYQDRSSVTLSVRFKIWGAAWSLFEQHPLRGLGFGGWTNLFPQYADMLGVERRFPPHNLLIATWAETGLPGLLLVLLFMGLTVRAGLRAVRRASDSSTATYLSLVLGAVVWVWIHGMGDNTFLYGSINNSALVALSISILVSAASSEASPPGTDPASDATTTPVDAPPVPAGRVPLVRSERVDRRPSDDLEPVGDKMPWRAS